MVADGAVRPTDRSWTAQREAGKQARQMAAPDASLALKCVQRVGLAEDAIKILCECRWPPLPRWHRVDMLRMITKSLW